MNNNDLTPHWPTIKSKLLEKYPTLKAEELVCEIGKEQELLKSLQDKLKINKKEIDNVLSLMG